MRQSVLHFIVNSNDPVTTHFDSRANGITGCGCLHWWKRSCNVFIYRTEFGGKMAEWTKRQNWKEDQTRSLLKITMGG